VSFSWPRVGAIFVKELRHHRRDRFVMVFTMTILPPMFIAVPILQLLTAPACAASSKLDTRVGTSLPYMLRIPAIVPSTTSAYSVVGKREQGTLEPILITPFHREEFLVGKALAALLPTVVVADTILGIFLAVTGLLAHPASPQPSSRAHTSRSSRRHAASVRICFALCVATCEVGAAECVGTSCVLVAVGRRGIK
jgi:ABC-type transport system involved in multi-copper enzyme maturation permease subunit